MSTTPKKRTWGDHLAAALIIIAAIAVLNLFLEDPRSFLGMLAQPDTY